jgi:glucosamine-6-phosphate deaminase
MATEFFARINPDLAVPEDHIFFPDINKIDFIDEKIAEMGGVDTVWAGVGAKGMVAFCEPPRSAYYRVSEEEYLKSKTRIVHLNDDTLVAYSERGWGGCYDAIPPMGITIGFKSMLTAKRAVYIVTTGSWKQTVVRVILFSGPTLEYPVTLFTGKIPECILCCDRATATHPMEKIKDPSALIR